MRVRDRMRQTVMSIEPDTGLAEASDILRKQGIRHLPVVHGEHLVGIVTDRDLRGAWPSQATSLAVREIRYKLDKVPVSEVMSSPVLTATPRMALAEACRIMQEKRIGALPVVDDNRLVGILTESDCVDALIDVLGAEATPEPTGVPGAAPTA